MNNVSLYCSRSKKRPQLGEILSNFYCTEEICQTQQFEAVDIYHCAPKVPQYQLGWGLSYDRKRNTCIKILKRALLKCSPSLQHSALSELGTSSLPWVENVF